CMCSIISSNTDDFHSKKISFAKVNPNLSWDLRYEE
ncbi:MAG: hypothetical protein ACI9WM_001803, partial [Arenicella sp.]